MSTVTVVSKVGYRVETDDDADEDSLVRIEWDRTDDCTVLHCMAHKCHQSLNSKHAPPCHCIAEVRRYRNDAMLTD